MDSSRPWAAAGGRHVHRGLRGQDERGVALPPGLRRLGQIGQHRGVVQVAPGFVDHHELDAGGFGRVVEREAHPLQEVEERRFAEVLVFGGAGEVDHLPVGELEFLGVGVVEVRGPRAVAVPAAHRRPHPLREGPDEGGERAGVRLEGVEVLDAGADLGGVGAGGLVAPDPEQAGDPAGEELEGALAGGQRERLERQRAVRAVGGELEVAAAEELGEPAVGAAEVQDQHPGGVLEALDEEVVEQEALARAGGAEDQRVAHVPGEEVVEEGRPPPGLEGGEDGLREVAADGFALRRAEERREAGGDAGAGEHAADLALARHGGHPGEPGGELAVAFADHLGVAAGEDAAEFRVEALRSGEVAVERDREREVAVGDAVRFEFHEGGAETRGLGLGGRVHHRVRGAFGLLDVRHHGVALLEVVALGAADAAPRGFERLRPPLQGDGEPGFEAVELFEEVGPGGDGGRGERVEDDGLAVEAEVAAFGFELRQREPPVEAAGGAVAVPGESGPVHQLGEEGGGLGSGEDGQRRHVVGERGARVHELPEADGRLPEFGGEVGALVGVAAGAEPVAGVVHEPGAAGRAVGGGLFEAGVRAPDDVGLEVLDARQQEGAALLLGELRDAVETLGREQRGGAAEQVEVEPGAGVEPGEDALPAAEDLVELVGGAAVDDGRGHAGDAEEFAGAGEAEGLRPEPAPVGQLVGERPGGLVVPPLGLEVHSRMSTCQALGLPGS